MNLLDERRGLEKRKDLMKVRERNRSIVTLDEKRRLSEEERRVDALALRAEERRDKLRKAAGSCK